MIKGGHVDDIGLFVDLIIDSLNMGISLGHDVLTALMSPPAMRNSNGIPATGALSCRSDIAIHPDDSDLVRRGTIGKLLCAVATSYHVFEVGPAPVKQVNWRRSTCQKLDNSREGREINAFLSNPNLQDWTSVKWTAKNRDAALRLLLDADEHQTVDHKKLVSRGSAAQQLNLRKNDRVWQCSYSHWASKQQQYQRIIRSISDAGFLQGPENAFLRSENIRQMEDKVLGQGPLRAKTFFVSGSLSTLSLEEVAELLRGYGGKLVRDVEVNRPDVIAIVGTGCHDFERGVFRYWQPRKMSEPELLQWLEDLHSQNRTLPAPPKVEHGTKRKRENDPKPLAENQNLAGSYKKQATGKKIEIIDLCNL